MDLITDVAHLFNFHETDDEQKARIKQVREAAKHLATVIDLALPSCADRTAAVRLLRECVWTVNSGICLRGKLTSA